ncbi:MAG: hypothetical protein K1X55_00415 [Chitinophagales bacterium]|nr:hypothetical protein [Chitinophagales bacterium]
MRVVLGLGLWIIAIISSFGQSVGIPLNHDAYRMLDRLEIKSGQLNTSYHSTMKPIDRLGATRFTEKIDTATDCDLSEVDLENIDFLYEENMEFSAKGRQTTRKPLLKIFYKHPAYLFHVDIPKFQMMINPVIDLKFGYDTQSKGFKFLNTRGAEIRGNVDNIFGYYAYITTKQAKYPEYVQQKIDSNKAIPGAGYYKPFKDGGYDYFVGRGYMTLTPTEHIGFTFGYDKNFIGDGYRSLFLSDWGNDYMFLKVNTRVWKINYTNIFAEVIREYPRRQDTILPKKYMAMHHFSIAPTRWLSLGIFESTVFSRPDVFELQYLNPLIFYRSIEQALGSPDNVFIGFNFKANFAKHFSLYGQLIFDELNFKEEFNFGETDKSFFYELTHPKRWWGTKFGTQLGLKYIDAFGVDNLDIQMEGNMVRPHTYQHYDIQTSYSHYNQSLAHPLGANFTELITIINYQPIRELNLNLKYIHSVQGLDSMGSNWGSNVLLDYTTRELEYGNYVQQGVETKTNYVEFLATYQPWHNVSIDFNYVFRKQNSEIDSRDQLTHFINTGFRINIPYKSMDY